MSDFIKFFIEEMVKKVIELTCAALVNILKYVPGVQVVEDAPYFLALIPDELKTQKMCEKPVQDDPWSLAYVPNHFKTKRM